MKTPSPNEIKETLEDGVIKSLCYLHQETLRGNLKELARVLQTAIEQSEHVIPASVSLSSSSNNLLQQFYVLRGFQSLDAIQKELFIRNQCCPVKTRIDSTA
jgi:hypothetical protein